MREAVVISYARTAMPKASRGAFNITAPETMAAHAISNAVERAKIDKNAVEDVFLGNISHGGRNLARLSLLLAGLPKTTGGVTINRFCSSGMQAVAMAAHSIIHEGSDVVVAGGVEALSLPSTSGAYTGDPRLVEMWPDIHMAMIDTADVVGKRYNISRETEDRYAYESQMRTAAAQQAGKFKDEIVPLKTTMKVVNKETKEETLKEVVADRDDCNRPDTTFEGLLALQPVRGGDNHVTAGNASQLSDGGAALVLVERKYAEKHNLKPLGGFRGWNVAGCDPDEMGIGPLWAIPRMLERQGLKIGDIDLWELNEAFANQCVYIRDKLGIDPDIYNVNGGAISIGHPFGMSGARMAGHLMLEGQRRPKVKYGVVSMCIGGGMGGAGLFEFYH